MALILITGVSTSGKSTIAKELVKRGYEAYDTEHDGISAWYDKQSGEFTAGFNEMPERTEAWLSRHEWKMSVPKIEAFAEQARTKPIFLCGGASNEVEVRALCQMVCWLKTDEATIRNRVQNPRDHDYGTRPHELAKAITDNTEKEVEYKTYGAVMVDATRPLDAVVDQIIRNTISS